jgi:hypothetical protein
VIRWYVNVVEPDSLVAAEGCVSGFGGRYEALGEGKVATAVEGAKE